ncbi:MAG TPA: trehalose-phosphatase [Thermoanaerobaculia bacterium]|nr:trehalose-phosphatase [Thermoanaerobaculia bacterium]
MTTLFAFDFDGTLAPICEDPTEVRMSRAAFALLNETSELAGVAVAVVSGRDVDDLAARTNASGAYLIGSHGLEIRGPGGVPVRDTSPLEATLDAPLREAVAAAGMRLETKKHAVALHWRGLSVPPPFDLILRFRAWARAHELDVIEGRCVVEARCRGGGKEDALRWLTNALGATRVVYAGDDVTDFGSLRFAAAHGRGVFVASEERAAPPDVTVVASFRELYRLIREEAML